LTPAFWVDANWDFIQGFCDFFKRLLNPVVAVAVAVAVVDLQTQALTLW